MSETVESLRAALVLAGLGSLVSAVALILQAKLRDDWRLSLVGGFVVVGTLAWLVTESLSAPRLISFTTISVAWSLILGLAGIALAGTRRLRPGLPALPALQRTWHAFRALPAEQIVMLVFTAFSVLVLAVVTLTAAPNTWDSLTYHLSRVMHWAQNHTLRFYATAIERQLSSGPLAEMAILNLQILVGGDRLANVVQLGAMLGCLLGGSLIARRLGAGPAAQVFAVLLILTLPMGLLQATSTQNDYVAALWCVSFMIFMEEQPVSKVPALSSALAGAGLGLAALTKVTTLLFLAPFACWHVLRLLGRVKWRAWRPLVILSFTALIVAAPHSLRNYGLYGNLLGVTTGPEQGHYINERLSPSVLLSNVLRNLGSELGSRLVVANDGIASAINIAHSALGIDINDPQTTWPGSQYQIFSDMHEDSEGNPLHLLLLFLAVAMLPPHGARKQMLYVACVAMAFLLFCFVLRWQPWGNRLLLPLFVIAMPFVATVLAARLPGAKVLIPAAVVGLAAIPYLLANPSRPLLGSESIFVKDRFNQYFTNVPDDFAAYDAAARAIQESSCADVGMLTRYDGREYLAWVMVRRYTPHARLEHILVRNVSRRFETGSSPCAIIVMNALPSQRLLFRDHVYFKAVATEALDLFVLSPASN